MRARNSYRSADRRAALVRDLMLTAGAVVGLCGAGQAYAQTAQPQTGQAAQGADDSIVVTGYRESIERSLEQKSNANAFIDVTTAEDVGKFHDKKVADSLQRVPENGRASCRERVCQSG